METHKLFNTSRLITALVIKHILILSITFVTTGFAAASHHNGPKTTSHSNSFDSHRDCDDFSKGRYSRRQYPLSYHGNGHHREHHNRHHRYLGFHCDDTAVVDVSLSDLTIAGVTLDQTFQSTQLSYTASASFLQNSVSLTAVTTDTSATITINGSAVATGEQSNAIALAEGDNTITIIVTGSDGTTSQSYIIEIARALATDFAQQAFLKASNAEAGDYFGLSVALAGDTLAVGAIYEDSSATGGESDNSASSSGAVYVFTRTGGVWSQQAYLKASNAAAGDNFGRSVALAGDTLAVGAYGEDSSATGGESDDSAYNSGAVYVFTRTGGVWSQQAFLKASNAGAFDSFGISVALADDTLAVGAYTEDSSASGGESDDSAYNSGAVYVFTRTVDVWSQQAFLKASNPGGGDDNFGWSVALAGDTLVVGALYEDSSASGGEGDDSAYNSGAVYVFTRTNDVWSQQAFLKASNAESGDYFGISVALADDTLAVGAFTEDSSVTGGESDNSAHASGAVYVFTRTGGVWSQQAYLKASNAETTDYFGISVALAGDTLAVGAYTEDSSATGGESDNSANNSGAVYVFTRTDDVWSQQAFLKASNAGAGDQFGINVALAGDTLAVGANDEDSSATGGENDNSALKSGAVYVWH